jgi:hypothetical protein
MGSRADYTPTVLGARLTIGDIQYRLNVAYRPRCELADRLCHATSGDGTEHSGR